MHNQFWPLWVFRKLDLFNSCRKQLKLLDSWWLWCVGHIRKAFALYDPDQSLSNTSQWKLVLSKLSGKRANWLLMFSTSVGHSLSLSSLPRITNSGHYESFKNSIDSKVAGNSSNHFSHDDFHIHAYSASFNSVRLKPKYVANGSLQKSFWQKFLGIE